MFAKIYEGVDEARINEVVKIVDLEKAIKDKVKTYSLGIKQRLGIAQHYFTVQNFLYLMNLLMGLISRN